MDSDPAGAANNLGNRHHQPTIYDIANAIGVSPSTVSRALNKPGRINANTEARIRAAAEELGYQGNPMARALPTGRTRTLALMISDITNPVYFPLIRAAEQAATSSGYTMILAESQDSPELESGVSHQIVPAIDGLVLVGSRLSDEQVTAIARRKAVMVVNREVPGLPAIVPDVTPGIQEAISHLGSLGHASIAYLGGPADSWMSKRRWDEVFDRAVAAGMSIVEIGPNAPTRESGRASLRRVLASGATAVLAYNDLMAIGLLEACRAEGIEVPHRLSVVGFDDIFGADFTSPPLTTIRTDVAEAGEAAVHALVAELDGRPADDEGSLSTRLIVRESTSVPLKRQATGT